MINCNFPRLKYLYDESPLQRGIKHGETYRDAIKELTTIRYQLMLNKNPSLKNNLSQLALDQFNKSKQLNPNLSLELEGIAKGSGLSLDDIVVLNNYTDFRDIELPEQGCSTVAFSGDDQGVGQTWDMHGSAKNYVNIIEIEDREGISTIIFSLVGCLGMMGINKDGCFVGVNNINTTKAKASVIWPLLVRDMLESKNVEQMNSILKRKPVTSGHNYLIADRSKAFHYEVSPTLCEQVSSLNFQNNQENQDNQNNQEAIFHTNHCLGLQMKNLEVTSSLSSTTHNRFDLLNQKTKELNTINDLKKILTDHDQFPKSICSHFENGSQDPSYTCGGGTVNLKNLDCLFWRGCPHNDQDYVSYNYTFKNRFLRS